MSDPHPTSIWQRLHDRPAFLVVAGLAALTILLAACGGGSDSEDATATATPTTTSSTTATPTPTPSGPLPEVTDVAPDLDFFGELAAVNSHPITATFDSAADSLTLADGAAIDVPAGAFPAATELSVAIIDLLFEDYLTNPPEARIYVLSTEADIVLGAPLVLEVPKPADSVNATRFVDGEWLPLDVPAGPTTRIEISHVSAPAVGRGWSTQTPLKQTIAVSDNFVQESDEPTVYDALTADIESSYNAVGAKFLVQCSVTVATLFRNAKIADSEFLFLLGLSACVQALSDSGLLDEGDELNLDCVTARIDAGETIEEAADACTKTTDNPSPEPDPEPEPEACTSGGGGSRALAQDPCPEPSEPPEEEPADPEGFLTLQNLSAVLDGCNELSSGNLQCSYTLGATLQYETSGLPSSISCDFRSFADSEREDLTEVSGTVTLTEGYIETLVGGTVFQDGNPILVKCRLIDSSAEDGDSFTVGKVEEELTLPLP